MSEASHTCLSQNATPSLGCAVQQAKLVLASVRGSASCSQVPIPISGGSYTVVNPPLRSTGLSPKLSRGGLGKTSSHPVRQDHRTEKVEEDADQFGIQLLAGDSVLDQVRRQKEKFWLSLAERGYVKPPESIPLNVEEVNVKGAVNSASEERAREEFASTLKKNKAASRTELHQQTSKSLTEQSQSSSMSRSYSSNVNPETNNRTQLSPSDKHSDSSSTADSRTKQSHPNERQIQQSLSVDSNTSSGTRTTTESQTFPSYEGISGQE